MPISPFRFSKISHRLFPWICGATLLCLIAGLYEAFIHSPPDYQQGEMVRVMYIHVPAAWMALGLYAAMAVAAATGLIWRYTLADIFMKAAAPIGAFLTLICLVTGSLWGKPTWGAFWVWDARLTSVLVLLFLYLGYIALTNAFDHPERGAKAGAILLLFGAVNLPIIKFSVTWWNTLHQPASLTRWAAPAIDPSMLRPLLLMALFFAGWTSILVILRMWTEIATRKTRTRQHDSG